MPTNNTETRLTEQRLRAERERLFGEFAGV